jgi:hypothetical protein
MELISLCNYLETMIHQSVRGPKCTKCSLVNETPSFENPTPVSGLMIIECFKGLQCRLPGMNSNLFIWNVKLTVPT